MCAFCRYIATGGVLSPRANNAKGGKRGAPTGWHSRIPARLQPLAA